MARFDPRLSGRAGQARAGGGGSAPNRYPASHGPTLPTAIPGSGIQFVEQTPAHGPPVAVGPPPWEKPAVGVKTHQMGGWFPTVQAFDVVTAAAGFSLAASPTNVEVVGFTVPSKARACLMGWGHECCDVLGWNSIRWRITINGSTQPGFDFRNQVAGIEGYRLSDARLYVPAGARVGLWAANASAGALVIFGRVKGFYWPYEESF